MGQSPFQVTVSVFMPGMKDAIFILGDGERLFTLTDKGLDECPRVGPDEVLVITEKFDCWPVVVFKVSGRDAHAWRATTAADHARMMARVRRELAPAEVVLSGPLANPDHGGQ